MSHAAAEALFARLCAWLETRGVPRGANVTELELGRRARARLGRDEAMRFIAEFYLPAVYGHGPRLSAEEAAALVDVLVAPPRRDEPATPVAEPKPAPVATDAAPPAAEERKCLCCGETLS